MKKMIVACLLLGGIWSVSLVLNSEAVSAETVVVIPIGGSNGDAVAGEVLKGKTFSNSISKGISGTRVPAPVEKTGSTSCLSIEGCDGTTQLGEAWPSPRFYNGIGFSGMGVEDYLTGLVWQNPVTTVNRTWQQAVDYCNTLFTGNGAHTFSDWRLPNVKELQSIVDFGQNSPSLPEGHPFTDVEDEDYWTSTRTGVVVAAYFVTMSFGQTGGDDIDLGKRAWCVRGPF